MDYEARHKRLLEMVQCAEKGNLLGAVADVAERADILAKRLIRVGNELPSVGKLIVEVHERLLNVHTCIPKDKALTVIPDYEYLLDVIQTMFGHCFFVGLGRKPKNHRYHMDAEEVTRRAIRLSDCAGEVHSIIKAIDAKNRNKSPTREFDRVTAALRKMMQSGVAYTSERKLADELNAAKTTVHEAISRDEELKQWSVDGVSRQSVKAVQLNDATMDGLTAPDISDAILPPEDIDTFRAKYTEHIRANYPDLADDILAELNADQNFETLAQCEAPKEMIETIASQKRDKRRDEAQSRQASRIRK